MAKFSQKDIYFKDNDMAVFGTDHDSAIFWDGAADELCITTTVSGVDPIHDYHLATKYYVDSQILTTSGDPTGYFDAYDSSGGTTVGTSWTDIPLGTVRKINTEFFSHSSGSSEVIIKKTGTYIIIARVTTTITTGTSRTDSSMRVVKDDGAGYAAVPGTTAVMYNRTNNLGENTGTVALVLDLEANDRIKIQTKRDNGSSTLALLAEGSSLTIFTTKGPKGDRGEDGAPGSGSSITLKHEGTTVSGSPFSILNFTGTAVQKVEQESSNQAEIYIEPDFGSWYGWNISDAESTTNSNSYVNKLTYTTPNIPAGYYRVGYQFEWRRNTTGNDFKARLQLDSATTIMEINEEPKDPNSWYLRHGFDIIYLTAGSHTFTLDFCGETTSATSRIRRARLEFWMITKS